MNTTNSMNLIKITEILENLSKDVNNDFGYHIDRQFCFGSEFIKLTIWTEEDEYYYIEWNSTYNLRIERNVNGNTWWRKNFDHVGEYIHELLVQIHNNFENININALSNYVKR